MSRHILDDEPIIGPDADVEMASEASPVFVGDLTFEPFKARRLYAANAMGLRAFRVTEEQREAIVDGDVSTYEGMLVDVVIVLYLCSQPLAVSLRALRTPTKVLEQAVAWGERNGVHPLSEMYAEFMAAYGQLIDPIEKNEAVQVVPSSESTDTLTGKKKLSPER